MRSFFKQFTVIGIFVSIIVPAMANDSTPAAQGIAGVMPNGVSVPSNFPHINITVNDNPDDGYIFLDNRTSGSNSYNVIFDNTGSPIWYIQTNDERRDMKVQRNGMLTMLARDGYHRFIGLDANYQQVAEYYAVNGYATDEHELIVLEDGSYFLIGVSGGVTTLQGFSPTGTPTFIWDPWVHYDWEDMIGTGGTFPHMNAIDIDEDGHILLSCRHLNEVTKINRLTGDIIWRLGGVNNQFTFINDSLNGFSYQHAIRALGGGRYLLFDNGNFHSPFAQISRGVEYELDTYAMTATLVWEYRETPDRYSYYMGNAQRLPNGNTLINWVLGGYPKLTEVRPDGTKAFEMNWVNNYESYRVWRCPWEGMALKPNLIIESKSDHLLLLFNKFGDPNVAYYNIYGGTSPEPTEILATSTTTMKRLDNLQTGDQYYFRVTAVNQDGSESDFSEEKSVLVSILVPGKNLVINGDFSDGKNDWIFQVNDTAQADWFIEDGVSHQAISQPGSQIHNILMAQTEIPLHSGQEYVLAFDAWADLPRQIESHIYGNFTNDSGPWATTITPIRTHYQYSFTISSTDFNAILVFRTGASTSDVYMDDIVVFAVAPGDFDKDGTVKLNDFADLASQWQMTGSGLSADLDNNNTVNIDDLLIFMDYWSLELM